MYLSIISKYLIAAVFSILAFMGLLTIMKPEWKRPLHIIRYVLIFMFQSFSMISIYGITKNIDYLFFYAFMFIVEFAFLCLYSLIYPRADREPVILMWSLLGTGFVIISRISLAKGVKQLAISVVGMVIFMMIPKIMKSTSNLRKWAPYLGALGFAGLVVVYFLGNYVNGSMLNVSIFGISFQPSEFIKIIFVIFIAGLLEKKPDLLRILISALSAGAYILVLVVSRDLGSAFIYFAIYVFMLFAATGNILYPLGGMFSGVLGCFAGYKLFSHVRVRFNAWLDPFSSIDKEGYQITQSLFAITSGGLFGLGLGRGMPENIPYVDSDFIFSAFCQEFGILSAFGLILICISCFLYFVTLAISLRSNFYRLTAFGLGICYIVQVFITIGGGIKLIPMTGVTLPLISYGGSSVMATIISFGLISGIRYSRKHD